MGLVLIVSLVVFGALVMLGAAGRWIDAGADRQENARNAYGRASTDRDVDTRNAGEQS